MKRGRNQRRRQGGSNPNRALDSNGPEVRIRGTANQIYDKYTALARDAASSGDRIKAESYLQHAEHYFRMIRSMQPAQPAQPPQAQTDGDGDQPSIAGNEEARKPRRNPEREAQADDAASGADNETAEAAPQERPKAEAPAANAEQANDEEVVEKKPKRRRTRRPAKTAENAEAASDDKKTAAAAE